MEITARIHSFETLGTVDGPGLRFIVFMQGCALKCKFCHNRDTWDLNGGKEYSLEELLNKIERYKNYFISSGGGVTFSGGEPLLQQDFLLEILPKLKDQNIHTAIDTSGNFTITNKVKKIIELTDLFLLDIKSIDDDICKKLCGVSNKKELEFAMYLDSIQKSFWIRHVLVPTITDKEENLIKLGKYIKQLKAVKKVEVIPYHVMGKYKWKELGLKYPLEEIREATSEDVKIAKELMRTELKGLHNLTFYQIYDIINI